jgi:hypothetical protein
MRPATAWCCARSSTTVDLEFYPAGASVPSATVLGVSWSSLR